MSLKIFVLPIIDVLTKDFLLILILMLTFPLFSGTINFLHFSCTPNFIS